jgi:putative transposase
VELNPELQRIQTMLQALLKRLTSFLSIKYLVLDGHFGNWPSAWMVRQNNLHLISKLRHDAGLYLPYAGPKPKRGSTPRLGEKIDYDHLPADYLVQSTIEDGLQTDIYQAKLWNQEFPLPLNVVIIYKTNLKTQVVAHVVLFSTDLELSFDKLIAYYKLRFQIEIVCTQMTKAGVFSTRAGWDNIAYFNFFIVNDHSVYQQFYQLPTLFEA